MKEKADKGQLVRKHMENMRRDVLEKYPHLLREFVRGKHGIYALYSKGKLYYVGLASNLRMRLKAHLKDRHANTWDSFSVYLTYEDYHMRELESLVMRIASPKGNRKAGGFTNSQDIKPLFKKSLTASHKKEIEMLFGDGKAARYDTERVPKSSVIEPPLAAYTKKRFIIKLSYKGEGHKAFVRQDGTISLNGNVFNSPSLAARAVFGRNANGWNVWKYRDNRGQWVPLDKLRTKK